MSSPGKWDATARTLTFTVAEIESLLAKMRGENSSGVAVRLGIPCDKCGKVAATTFLIEQNEGPRT